MGRAIAQIADLKTSSDPRSTFTVGKVSGGTGVTAIAAEAAMSIDIRANDAAELTALETRILAAVDQAVSAAWMIRLKPADPSELIAVVASLASSRRRPVELGPVAPKVASPD